MHEMDTFWVASRSRLAHGSGGRLGECGFANESFLLIVIFRIEAQECDHGFIGGCTFIFKGNFRSPSWLLAINFGENGEGTFPLLRALPRRYYLLTLVDLLSE